MPMTEAPAGMTLTIAVQDIYNNPANSGLRKTVRVRFMNIDGIADGDLTAYQFFDASAAALCWVLPKNVPVMAQDAIEIDKILDPGDVLQAAASADAVIAALPEVIFSEPV